MDVTAYNVEGKENGTARLPNEVFAAAMNSDLLHQAIRVQQERRSQGSAHTKDRSEKRGGGRKPWQQKYTGRARHGSVRSPLWRAGGVTFGPRAGARKTPRLSRQMRRKALFVALSAKASDGELIVLDTTIPSEGKSRQLQETLQRLLPSPHSCLIVTPEMDNHLVRAAANIPQVGIMEARELNAFDVLQYRYIILPKEAVTIMKRTFL